jgi:hypothetical protein
MVYLIKNKSTGFYVHANDTGKYDRPQFKTGAQWNAKAFATYQEAFNFRANFGAAWSVVEGN